MVFDFSGRANNIWSSVPWIWYGFVTSTLGRLDLTATDIKTLILSKFFLSSAHLFGKVTKLSPTGLKRIANQLIKHFIPKSRDSVIHVIL